MFYWFRNMKQVDFCFDVLDDTEGKSNKTVSDIYSYCREVCSVSLMTSSSKKIGGKGVIVEIDESNFRHRKFGVGRSKKGSWVVGAVERAGEGQKSTAMKFILVSERSKATLHEIIKSWCKKVRNMFCDDHLRCGLTGDSYHY